MLLFKNRKEAGVKLSELLKEYKNRNAVVFALARGGVVLGVEIAKALDVPLDLIITKKIGYPNNPEYAICVIAEEGEPVCNEEEINYVDRFWLEEEVKQARLIIKARRLKYLLGPQMVPIEGRIVIVVDDGIATGLTMLAAITEIKKGHPAKIIVAIPITPSYVAEKLHEQVDELATLDIDINYLGAVGAYYLNFPQVEDDEVIALLTSLKRKEVIM